MAEGVKEQEEGGVVLADASTTSTTSKSRKKTKNYTIAPLPFKERVLSHIKEVEKVFEQAKRHVLLVRYLKKHDYLLDYIEALECFSVTELYDFVRDFQSISKRTVSRYLQLLLKEQLISLYDEIVTRMGTPVHIYYLESAEKNGKLAIQIDYYRGLNPEQERQEDSKDKKKEKQKDPVEIAKNTFQARLAQHFGNKKADEHISQEEREEKKEELAERGERSLSREQHQELKRHGLTVSDWKIIQEHGLTIEEYLEKKEGH